MKTTHTSFIRIFLALMLAAGTLTFSACNVSKGDRQSEATGAESEQTLVKPPSIDIHTATVLGDLDAIKQHIAAGSDLDQKEPAMGSTPLISAAVFGKTEIARALIEGGADVNIQNNEGSSALHSAAFLCRLEIVEMLLANGAEKEVQNVYGSTPLISVAAPFSQVKEIYDQFSKDLGPLGFKLDYSYVEETRPKIAALLQ